MEKGCWFHCTVAACHASRQLWYKIMACVISCVSGAVSLRNGNCPWKHKFMYGNCPWKHVYVAVKLGEGGRGGLLFRVFALKLFLSLVHWRSGCNWQMSRARLYLQSPMCSRGDVYRRAGSQIRWGLWQWLWDATGKLQWGRGRWRLWTGLWWYVRVWITKREKPVDTMLVLFWTLYSLTALLPLLHLVWWFV